MRIYFLRAGVAGLALALLFFSSPQAFAARGKITNVISPQQGSTAVTGTLEDEQTHQTLPFVVPLPAGGTASGLVVGAKVNYQAATGTISFGAGGTTTAAPGRF